MKKFINFILVLISLLINAQVSFAETTVFNPASSVGTASALAANGANCSAGSYPLGVDASGAVEGCTVATTGTVTNIATSTGLTGGAITTTGTLSFDYSTLLASNPALTAGQAVFDSGDSQGGIFFEGAANNFEGLLTVVSPSADRTWTLPDVSGTIITTGDTNTVTDAMVSNTLTASTLGANGANCSSGAFPAGVDAVGAVESCSTATYPLTTTAKQILYSSATSVVGEITTANNGTLMTDSAGTPTVTTTPDGGWYHNISVVRATTTNAGDSIKITSAGGSALSASNSAWIDMPGVTAGQATRFPLTADVTILLTGAVWTMDNADVTGALLRVMADNDNGTLRLCVGYLGGRETLLTTDTSATQSNIDTAEEVLCNTAVGSATNTVKDLALVRANFDTTGGAAENLWAVQSGVNDIVTGKLPDTVCQPWNPTTVGFASITPTTARWCQSGRLITAILQYPLTTSNATTYTATLPAKALQIQSYPTLNVVDNSAALTTGGLAETAVDSTTLSISKTQSGGAWTASGTKKVDMGAIVYEVGPAASFIN